MTKNYLCDFCGRTQAPQIEMDADALWVCSDCKLKIISEPITLNGYDDLDKQLKPLVGKSAGAICRTLELAYEPPFETVLNAASNIGYDQDTMMSAWLFVSQWLDGTTIWRKSDSSQIALVSENGEFTIQDVG